MASLLISGCSKSFSGTRENGTFEQNDDSIFLRHSLMDGEYSKKIKLDEGEYRIKINSKSDKGKIKIIVKDKAGEEVINEENPEKFEKIVKVDKSSEFDVEIIGEDHGGVLELYWNIK